MTMFNGKSTTDDVIKDIDLSGKTAVVTGVTSGLGIETASALLRAGIDEIIITGRQQKKLEEVASELRKTFKTQTVHTRVFDLADLDSVAAAAESILSQHEKIHLLNCWGLRRFAN